MLAIEPMELVHRLREDLAKLYGDRLKDVVLHGSHATGQASPESDIDVLIVLDVIGRYWDELEATASLVADLSLEAGATINVSFVPEAAWEAQESTFLRQARATGIAA